MKREFTLTLDGIDYPVVADGDTIVVNERPFTVEVDENGMILVDGIAYDVVLDGPMAVVDGQALPFKVDGLSAVATASPGTRPSQTAMPSSEAAAGAICAIMPGKIIRVLVEPGQPVVAGTPVCTLEAMKMENELHASQNGIVRGVYVRPGDDVEKGQILLEID